MVNGVINGLSRPSVNQGITGSDGMSILAASVFFSLQVLATISFLCCPKY